jgi:hypothetical protein
LPKQQSIDFSDNVVAARHRIADAMSQMAHDTGALSPQSQGNGGSLPQFPV